jgi:hypothetical protein
MKSLLHLVKSLDLYPALCSPFQIITIEKQNPKRAVNFDETYLYGLTQARLTALNSTQQINGARVGAQQQQSVQRQQRHGRQQPLEGVRSQLGARERRLQVDGGVHADPIGRRTGDQFVIVDV